MILIAEFHCIDDSNQIKQTHKLINAFTGRKIDKFYHDARHSYEWALAPEMLIWFSEGKRQNFLSRLA